MKTNFNLDLALFFTSLSIILYSCGYFYIKAYTNYFDFTHESLGFDFQNFLIYGGLQGSQVIIIGILIPITLSLINKLIKQDVGKSIVKILYYILLTFIITIFKILTYFLKCGYFFVNKLSNFIYRFYCLSFILEVFMLLLIFIFLSPFIPIILLLKKIKLWLAPSVLVTHNYVKNEIAWDSTVDAGKIDQGFKELIIYYLCSIVIYSLFFVSVYYLIDIEKDGLNDAKNTLRLKPTINITIKDEKISQWYTLNELKEPSNKKVKFLICGKVKCLIAIEVPSKISFTEQSLIMIKPYFFTTINNDGYSTY